MRGPLWRSILYWIFRNTLCHVGIHPLRWKTAVGTNWCPACQRHMEISTVAPKDDAHE